MPDDFLKNMSIKMRAEGWQKTLADNEVFKLIATVDNKVVGFVSSGPADEKSGEFGDGEVYAIYVLAEHYRQGVGRVLFSRAAQNGVGKGGKSKVVSFIAQNKRAVKFYRSMGGIEVGNGDVEISGAVIPEKIYVFRSLATLTP